MAAPAPSPSSSSAGTAASASASPFELVDAQSCSLCMDPFATAAHGHSISSDRRPRVLSCGHSFCGSCLHLDMQQRRCCATCRAPIAFASASAVPVNFDLIASLQSGVNAAKQTALPMQVDQAHAAHRQTAAAPCAECAQAATHFCEQCDRDLCLAHSQQVHALRMFQGHTVVALAEKAALIADIQKGEPKARAKKCAMHPDQDKCLFCSECDEAICAVCAQGRHAAHPKIEIAEAAAQTRKRLERELELVAGSEATNRSTAAAGLATLADADALRAKIRDMQTELQSSSAQAQSDLGALAAELTAAVQRRHAELTQQLQQQKETAGAILANLLSAADRAVEEGAQLRAAVAATAASDDHGALAEAPRIGQHCAIMRDRLRALKQEVTAAAGSGVGGCVTALSLENDTKAATLSALAQLGKVTQQCTAIAVIQSAQGSLRHLESCVLPPASDATLLQFFGGIPVPTRLLYRASRDGFRFKDWKAKCMGKGPTMTLVKAKESGFVFGAYTHCQWPKADSTVVDPTAQSFLFSLTNASGQAVRFSLHNKTEAVRLNRSGIYFGGTANFVLHYDGMAADNVRGNAATAFKHYQPDDGDMNRGADFWAGLQFFAAADIEVYDL